MDNRIRNILRGIGSIFDIMPKRRAVDFRKVVKLKTAEEITAEAWARVEKDLSEAMGQFSEEAGIKRRGGKPRM